MMSAVNKQYRQQVYTDGKNEATLSIAQIGSNIQTFMIIEKRKWSLSMPR